MRYLLDTSTLILAVERGVLDRLSHDPTVSELLVPEQVLAELEGLVSDASRRARSARAALELAKQTLKVVHEPASAGHVDDVLLEIAEARGYGIISQDRVLISRAKERGISTLTLKRSGKIGD